MNQTRIILTGFMGTGKTSVGRELSEKLDFDFLDTDMMVEVERGKSINQIFETQGEPAFRELEKKMLQKALARDQVVVSTGGGAIVDPQNLKLMKERGTVVALSASKEAILERIASLGNRPLLEDKTEDKKDRDKQKKIQKKIEDLLSHRSPFYAQADAIIDTTARSVAETVEEILKVLHGNNPR